MQRCKPGPPTQLVLELFVLDLPLKDRTEKVPRVPHWIPRSATVCSNWWILSMQSCQASNICIGFFIGFSQSLLRNGVYGFSMVFYVFYMVF